MDLIITRELANIYICKAIEKMLLAEFKVLHIINRYAALPVKHLIRVLEVSSNDRISAMCCNNINIYYIADCHMYVYDYNTHVLVKCITYCANTPRQIKLTYSNDIIHLSYDKYDYTIYKLFNAKYYYLINTFKIKKTTYIKYWHYEPVRMIDNALSAIKAEYTASIYESRSNNVIEHAYHHELFPSQRYYFKHDTYSSKILNNILLIYSSNAYYIYYIDELINNGLNDHIMEIPCDDNCINMLLYCDILYIVNSRSIVTTDLNKKTYYVILYKNKYTTSCIAPNGNLLLANNKTIDEYF